MTGGCWQLEKDEKRLEDLTGWDVCTHLFPYVHACTTNAIVFGYV